MNAWLLIAAVLSFILGVGHTLLGEWCGDRVLVRRIASLTLFENMEKDRLAKRIVRLAWHATSIMWCAFGGLIFYCTFIELNNQVVIAIRIASLSFFAISVLAILTVPRKMWLFLGISITAWMGTL